jgi:hypothetical protein
VRRILKFLVGMVLTPLLVGIGVLILARDLFVIRRTK